METNKQIALRALTGAFINRDPNVVKHFTANYIQHNPTIPNGPAAIIVRALGAHGHSRRFGDVRVMSAFPLIATEPETSRHVSNVPLADIGCSA
jgi:hypothetical protein